VPPPPIAWIGLEISRRVARVTAFRLPVFA